MVAGIRSGVIHWHAFPTNAQPELHGAADFVALGLAPARALAAAYGVEAPRVLSQRDVPGITRSVVRWAAAKTKQFRCWRQNMQAAVHHTSV